MSLKPVKKSDRGKSWMQPRRDSKRTIQPEYHLIITEGTKTEPLYFEALKERIIKAAYFDVLVHEPPRVDEPLLTLPNFYLTPHIASRSAEAEKNTADMATQIILEALRK